MQDNNNSTNLLSLVITKRQNKNMETRANPKKKYALLDRPLHQLFMCLNFKYTMPMCV